MDMFMDCRSRYFERVSWEAFGSMRETELNMLLDMKVDDVEDRINLVYLWQNHPIKTRGSVIFHLNLLIVELLLFVHSCHSVCGCASTSNKRRASI